MRKISLNDTIYFRLTEFGKRHIDEKIDEINNRIPKAKLPYHRPFYKDWYRDQLHSFMHDFGEVSLVGGWLPAYDVTTENPKPNGPFADELHKGVMG